MNQWRVIPSTTMIGRGTVTGPLFEAPCALGKSGMVIAADGREGDGRTPAGSYPIRTVFYRPDREAPPVTALPCSPLAADMGWCDAPDSPRYNKRVTLPFGASHEKMWREDSLYDLVVVIGHNDGPVVPGLGSAIFLHVAREGLKPTEGCVTLEKSNLRRLLRQVKPTDRFRVEMPSMIPPVMPK